MSSRPHMHSHLGADQTLTVVPQAPRAFDLDETREKNVEKCVVPPLLLSPNAKHES